MQSKPNIVIAGSGPIGTYIGILLARGLESRATVTIVDEFANLRPGVIAKQAVEAINEFLPDIEVPSADCIPDNAIFIKDLQVALKKVAVKSGVNFIKANFAAVEEDQVILSSGQSLNCDLLIDCTGERRAVVRQTGLSVELIAETY